MSSIVELAAQRVEALIGPIQEQIAENNRYRARSGSTDSSANEACRAHIYALQQAAAEVRRMPVDQHCTVEQMAKAMVRCWGFVWVEFEDAEVARAQGEDQYKTWGNNYAQRLNAQDAARSVLRLLKPKSFAC